jgi:hypothetical protein
MEETKLNIKLPDEVENISVFYDGGRFSVHVNGKEFYVNNLVGNDFSFDVDKERGTITIFNF